MGLIRMCCGKKNGEIFAYKFDSYLARPANQMKVFAATLLLMTGLFGFVWFLLGGNSGPSPDFVLEEAVWESWLLIMDTGNQADAEIPMGRAAAAIATVMGLIFSAVLTGFVCDAVKVRMDNLRMGKVSVKEWNHTLLIGWTDRSIAFLQQIALANESDGGGVVVVLSERNKLEMEFELWKTITVEELYGTKVVFRNGSTLNTQDLVNAACETARSVVVMSVGETSAQADANTLRVVLALMAVGDKLRGYVVAEVRDTDMNELLGIIGNDAVETLQTNETLARMSLSAVKEPGITKAYEVILGFEGAEFYTKDWPQLIGKKFSELAEMFPEAVPIGTCSPAGEVVLNPPNDLEIVVGMGIVVLAEDDDSYQPKNPAKIAEGFLPPKSEEIKEIFRYLLCGWSDEIHNMLKILDMQNERGTEVHLLSEVPIEEREEHFGEHSLQMKHLVVSHIEGNPATWRTLKHLDLHAYNVMLVVSDSAKQGDLIMSDSHNLASILLLSHADDLGMRAVRRESMAMLDTNNDGVLDKSEMMAGAEMFGLTKKQAGELFDHLDSSKDGEVSEWEFQKACYQMSKDGQVTLQSISGGDDDEEEVENVAGGGDAPVKRRRKKKLSKRPIFCEILDTRTQKLLQAHPKLGQSCNFFISNRLMSKVLAMVAEDRKVRVILDILLGGETALMIKPPWLYAKPKEEISFFVLTKRCQKFNQVLCGYQEKDEQGNTITFINPENGHGINKSTQRVWDDTEFVVMGKVNKPQDEPLSPDSPKESFAAKENAEKKKPRKSMFGMHGAPSVDNVTKSSGGGGAGGGGNRASGGNSDVQLDLMKLATSNPTLHELPFFLEGGLGMDFAAADDLTVIGLVAGGQAEAQRVQVGWRLVAVNKQNVHSHSMIVSVIQAMKAQGVGFLTLAFEGVSSKGGEGVGAASAMAANEASSPDLAAGALAGLDEYAIPDPATRELALRQKIADLENQVQQERAAALSATATVTETFKQVQTGYLRQVATLTKRLAEGGGGPVGQAVSAHSGRPSQYGADAGAGAGSGPRRRGSKWAGGSHESKVQGYFAKQMTIEEGGEGGEGQRAVAASEDRPGAGSEGRAGAYSSEGNNVPRYQQRGGVAGQTRSAPRTTGVGSRSATYQPGQQAAAPVRSSTGQTYSTPTKGVSNRRSVSERPPESGGRYQPQLNGGSPTKAPADNRFSAKKAPVDDRFSSGPGLQKRASGVDNSKKRQFYR